MSLPWQLCSLNWSVFNPNPLAPEDIITVNPTVSHQKDEPPAL